VNEEGKDIWSLTTRRWYGKEWQRRFCGDEELLLDGHQMGFTTKEDDAGNPFLVVMLCQGTEYKTSYTYLIGKKQNSRFGRLGFSAEEYVRLAYGRTSRVKIDEETGHVMEEKRRRVWHRVLNPMKNGRGLDVGYY
jgi:hypothetical protein